MGGDCELSSGTYTHPPSPHPCIQADTGSRRHWPESGKLPCRWGGRAGPDTRLRPPHSAAPQSLEGRCSRSLQVWGCRSHGCDRAGIDKRWIPLSSSVHCSLGHTTGKGDQTGNQLSSPSQHYGDPAPDRLPSPLPTFQFKASFSSPSITALCSPTLRSQLHDTQSFSGVQPSPSSSPKASYSTLPLNNSSVFGKTSLSQPHLHQALSCFID